MHTSIVRLSACLLLATCLSSGALAAERRFMPVAASAAQHVEVVGTTPIVSANASGFGGGASLMPVSTRASRVLVSVRNLGSKPLAIEDARVEVDSGGRSLDLRAIGSDGRVAKPGKAVASAPRSSACLNVPQSSYSSCLEMDSRRAELERAIAAGDTAATEAIAPGKTRAMQFLVDLPRKSGKDPASMTVSIRVGGESLNFEFREVE